jgi:hypothetical protein
VSQGARPRLALAVFVAALAVVAVAGSASSSVASLEVSIDPAAQIKPGGRVVAVGGLVTCSSGYKVRLRLAVIQRVSGAYAEGSLPQSALCSGGPQRWTISATAKAAGFQRGRAEVCILGTTRSRVGYTGLLQSCKAVGVSVTK